MNECANDMENTPLGQINTKREVKKSEAFNQNHNYKQKPPPTTFF